MVCYTGPGDQTIEKDKSFSFPRSGFGSKWHFFAQVHIWQADFNLGGGREVKEMELDLEKKLR